VQERETREKERRIRWRESREQRDEEYRLREQQGLSPSATSKYSSSGGGEEDESDRGQPPSERWDPAPPSPRAAEAAKEQAPGEAPTAGRSVEEAARAAEVPVRAAEASGSTAVATAVASTTPIEPSRKMKRGFSTLW
jgi:hypothetical protein